MIDFIIKRFVRPPIDLKQVSIQVLPMDDLLRNDEMMKEARRMTLSPYSGMNYALTRYGLNAAVGQHTQAYGIFASYQGEYVGWAMLTAEPDELSFIPSPQQEMCSHVYVSGNYRRLGIGTKLMEKVLEVVGTRTLAVYSSDQPQFFGNLQPQHPNMVPVNG